MYNTPLLATNNKGKVREYRELLRGIPQKLVIPEEVGIVMDVEETGKSFEENARIKAIAFAEKSNLLTLADDSGLEVDALGGEPGTMSARYAGKGATDRQRVEFLLSKLKGVPWKKRTARFRCVIAIARPGREVTFCDGKCEGIIAFEPRGDNGFGYDPIFYFPDLNKTMAQLPSKVKSRVSHRGQATKKAVEILIMMG